MAKPKCPFKKFQLRAIKREEWTPPCDKPEPTESHRRGYFPGSAYTPAEVAFLKAVESLRKKSGRKFLSAVDHLRVALTLGYRLPVPAPPTPRPPMDAESVIRRMVELGFSFSTTDADDVSFKLPADAEGDAEKEHLCGLIAWGWAWLQPAAARHLTHIKETAS